MAKNKYLMLDKDIVDIIMRRAERLRQLDKITNPTLEELFQKRDLNWVREFAYPSLDKPFSAVYKAMFE